MQDNKVCDICSEEYEILEKCKQCTFYSCSTCIKKWFIEKHEPSCPGCRHNFNNGKVLNAEDKKDPIIIEFEYLLYDMNIQMQMQSSNFILYTFARSLREQSREQAREQSRN